jgi:uncharacterized protein involved in outer membrane biogenesis
MERMMTKFKWVSLHALVLCVWLVSACTPTYDWREVHGTDAPFSILMPAKPATFSRMVNLNGQHVMMTMTAAEVDKVTFAVGTAALPDAEKARIALTSMKSGLVKNISGTIKRETASENKAAGTTSIEIDAVGPPSPTSSGEPVRLVVHFVAKGKLVYQVLMVGREKALTHDAMDTFFASFKLN